MAEPGKRPRPGEGISKLDATTVFKVTNFELFVKPNKYVMGAGLVAITLATGYLYYINRTYRKTDDKIYIAVNEDATESIRERKSKWD